MRIGCTDIKSGCTCYADNCDCSDLPVISKRLNGGKCLRGVVMIGSEELVMRDLIKTECI